MKDKLGVTVVGRQVGSVEPVLAEIGGKDGSVSYRHNVASFKKMWGEVGQRTGTKWSVVAEFRDTDVRGSAASKILFFEMVRIA